MIFLRKNSAFYGSMACRGNAEKAQSVTYRLTLVGVDVKGRT